MTDDTKRKSAAKVSKREPRGEAKKPITTERFRARLNALFKRLLEAEEPEARDLAAYTVNALVGAYDRGGHAEVGRVIGQMNKVINSGKQEGAAGGRYSGAGESPSAARRRRRRNRPPTLRPRKHGS